jgi:hypothetical protein
MNTITTNEIGAETLDVHLGDGISELSSRSANGIDVALVWRHRDDTAIVVVADHRTGEELALEVHDGDNALDMFHHPYAYAATRSFGEPVVHISPAGVDR